MKQATLFKAWHPKGSTTSEVPKPKDKPPDDIVNLSDEDDQFLIQAMDETLAGNLPSTSFAQGAYPSTQKALENLEGFDVVAGQTWIYPTNYPVRSYQFNIVQTALFKNTMVILPTGLGKTFIAAVVMYNFYRWYPTGKIVFMAPTRPLVAQQIEACYNIMGIPLDDTMEMTGTVPAGQRAQGWRERRVFFLTPQVMMNDLLRNALRPQDVKCLVIDEAHKALGSYSYCQVVQEIIKYNNQFRVLALSATPGTDVKAVRSVLENLMISHVELRTEESLDIQQYTQKRTIDKVVVPLGEEIGELKNKFLGVIRTYLDRLERLHAIPRLNPESLGKYRMLLLKDSFQQNPPNGLSSRECGQLLGHFSLLISLYHAFELLLAHGMQPFFYFLKGIVDGEKSQPRVRYELMHNSEFEDLYTHLERRLGVSEASANDTLHPTAAAAASSLYENTLPQNGNQGEQVMGHPKLAKLEEIILEHFRSFASNEGGTRVMVFSQYRDSVKEITTCLNRHQPLVKAMNFVGQRTGTAKGFSQKEQLLVVRKFREGGYNVLVSTCVGEEGLDIGEIDLIVCFDAPKSPIRLVQRMGRTGRKRAGRIVVLLTEGKEEQAYKESNYKKQNIHRAITSGRQLGNLYEASPRMVPRGINPVCHRMFMTVPEYNSAKSATATGRKPRSILNFFTGKQQKKVGAALNKQEELYYEAHYEVDPSTVPLLPSPSQRFLCLRNFPSKEEKTRDEGTKNRPRLSLSNWTQWQCNEQRAHFLAHSSKTKLFVHLMRFMETAHCGDDGFDAYSLELKPFLQKEYILSSDECLSPDPDMVDAEDRNGKTSKRGRRKKFTKKIGVSVAADSATSDEEMDDGEGKQSKAPDDLSDGKANRKEPTIKEPSEGSGTKVKKKKKKRVINDYFKDRSPSPDSLSDSSAVIIDLCSGVKKMDCQEQVKSDQDFIEVVSSAEPPPDADMENEELLEPDPPEVEIRTPPRLDTDVFPSKGYALPPIDVAKILFGKAETSGVMSPGKLDAAPAVETMDCRVSDTEFERSGVIAGGCEARFLKLEVASDVEDFLDDDNCLKDDEGLGDVRLNPCLESSCGGGKGLKEDKASSVLSPALVGSRRHREALSPVAVEAWDLVGDANMDSFCDELFNSQKGAHENDTHAKVTDKKGSVSNPVVISTQKPAECDRFSDELFDAVCDEAAMVTGAVQLNAAESSASARAPSPIAILSQKLAPPAHSTPCRSTRKTIMASAARSSDAISSITSKVNTPSPIRKAIPVCEDSDWDVLGDSDVELFENISDGHVSDHNDVSGDEQGCEDMGITELCNFIEENSVVEAAKDGEDSVFHRSEPAQMVRSTTVNNATLRDPGVICDDARSSPVNKNSSFGLRNKLSGCVRSLSMKEPKDATKNSLNTKEAMAKTSPRLTEVKSRSIAVDSTNCPSTHTSVHDDSAAAKSFSAVHQTSDLNETSASKRPSFEITVSWSDFESGNSSDEPPTTVRTLTQKQRGKASLPLTAFSMSGMTQSRNVPVALVKPMMCSTSKVTEIVSSDSDSPVRVRRKRPRQRRISSASSTESEPSPPAVRKKASRRVVIDSDDDFQVLTCKKQHPTQKEAALTQRKEAVQRRPDRKERETSTPARKRPKKTTKKNKNNFVEQEADVSADVINSTDESENSSLDQLDESFIDDQTQVPNETLYLRAVRSPVGAAKFKIGHTSRVRYSEVFSQPVHEDDEDYIQDSFCVGNDDSSVLHRLSSSVSEKEELEEDSLMHSPVKTKLRKKRIHIFSSEDESHFTEMVNKSPKVDADNSAIRKRYRGKLPIHLDTKSPGHVTGPEISGCALADLPGNRPAEMAPSSAMASSQLSSREERLRLQKIKQEEFRRMHMASLLTTASSAVACVHRSPAKARVDSTTTIIVDTREIASGTTLVSTLRACEGVRVEVHSLSVGSLVVGRRCCVMRRALADFGNPQNHSRFVDEVRRLFELYDRPCVILERPQRVKPGERQFKRTKYFDSTLMFLTSTHAKVFFSQSQGNTAELVLALAKKECQKGMALASPDCIQDKNHIVQFYLAFPKVSLATAISLASAFPSVRALVNSSVEELQELTKISESRAMDILDFCRMSAVV
ncbi:FA complementation group M isoform X1 [Amblyomma americanum]